MTAASTLVERYQLAADWLLQALRAHSEARAAHDTARDRYEDARRELLVGGLSGLRERCPAEEREALMQRALQAELSVLRLARDALRLAETELEAARVVERAERETLRSIQRDYEFHAQARAQAI